MVCPVCPAAGYFGGLFGGYFGIEPPKHPGGRIFSATITASLIGITVIALKAIFNISLCVGGTFTWANIARVGSKTLVMGMIYSIGVNYILNRYVFPKPQDHPKVETNNKTLVDSDDFIDSPPCCCKKKVR